MNFVFRKLSELKQYENNPRQNQDAVDFVYNSIVKYGYLVPIVIDENDVIIAGHTRYAALCRINAESGRYDEINCILASDLTEEQIKEFRIVDNQVAGIATWDFQKLKIELEVLPNFKLDEFGIIAGFNDIVITPEDVLTEPKINQPKVQIKVGPETYDWDESHYHSWANYVITRYGVSPMEFIIERLEINEADRSYEEVTVDI